MNRFLEQESHLSEAASYFLYRSYQELEDALVYERAGLIFGKSIMDINPPSGWEVPEDGEDDDTISRLAEAWQEAQALASSDGPKLDKNHIIQAVSLAGHVSDLHTCVEAVTNRTLLQLKQAGRIEGAVNQVLDSANLLPKLLYLLKEEFRDGRLHLGHLKSLSKLRNMAVHYKAKSRSSLSAEIKTVLDVNREVGKLLDLTGGNPTGGYLRSWLSELEARYVG